MSDLTASEIRRQLKHPVIDCDGHWIESMPIMLSYLEAVGGSRATDGYRTYMAEYGRWYRAENDAELFLERAKRSVWWLSPSRAENQATFRLPKLLNDRMKELGIDYSIIYPTAGLNHHSIKDDELRRAVVRAHNRMTMDLFRPYAERITPVALVTTETPQEAIDELTYCVRELGYKAALMRGSNQRRTSKKRRYVDVLGLDNEQDYDPLWQACVELGVAVTFHDGAVSWQNRASVTNYVYNHVGHFAEANHAVCKAVFLGGVTRRFPDLRFGFLEGGAGWARNLYLDLIGHFEKRSLEATRAHLDPALFDAEEFGRLYDRYGGPDFADHRDAVIENILAGGRVEDRHIDDFAACGCTSREGVAAEFSRNFFFGCEADDPMTATAFDARLGKPLKAVFSSDIGHWDVPIINNVLPEAYELLEHGLLDEESFRRFTFGNAVELHGGMNPDFFKGTRVEKEAAQELGPRAASAH